MRSLQVCTGFPPDRVGGVENIVHYLRQRLAEEGHDVHVITRLWKQRLLDGSVIQVATPAGEASGYLVWALNAMAKIVELKPDIVHCHGLEGAIICNLLRFSRSKKVMHLHNSLTREATFLSSMRHRGGYEILRKACRTADVIICPTKVVGDDLIKNEPDIHTARIKIVPNFAEKHKEWSEDQVAKLKVRLGVDSKHVILYFGKVKRSKGLEIICQAYQLLANKESVSLVVAGAPTRTDNFLRYLESKYPDVIFTGYVDEPAPYFQIADVFCIYTQEFEGGETFAIALAEAMRHKVPVVCSDNPIFREVTGGYAFFAPPKNPIILSSVLSQSLNDRAKSKYYAEKAHQLAESRYAPQVFYKEIVRIYHQLLS